MGRILCMRRTSNYIHEDYFGESELTTFPTVGVSLSR